MILQEMWNFYFSSDFDGVFCIWFLSESSVVCQQIFSIFYRFWVIRGQSSGGRGIQFRIIWKIFIFNTIWIVFFSNDSLWKNEQSETSFEENMSLNDLLYSHITVSSIYCVQLYILSNTLLCPAHYCVQQNTVSTLTQRVFCSPFTFQCGRIMLRLQSTSVNTYNDNIVCLCTFFFGSDCAMNKRHNCVRSIIIWKRDFWTLQM